MRLTLRGKLLLVSLSLLALPWVGHRFVRDMEALLRQGQVRALGDTAQAVATLLADRPAPFERHAKLVRAIPESRIFYAHPFQEAPTVDGYADEWQPYLDLARRFGSGPGLSFRHLLGLYRGDLYALFVVKDDHIVYRDPGRSDGIGDSLTLTVADGDTLRRYELATSAPGRLNAYRLLDGGRRRHWEPAIRGEWQETPGGYTIELRMPLSLVGRRLAFTLTDVDDPHTRAVAGEVDTADSGSPAGLGVVLLPEPEIETLLHGMRREGSRLWVVDAGGRVLAVSGRLGPPPGEGGGDDAGLLLDLVYRLFTTPVSAGLADPGARATRLEGQEVAAALAGRPASRWRASPAGGALILSAAYPVRLAGGVAGAVVAEQTSAAILSLQNRAIEELFNATVAAFAVVAGVLLLFATRLSLRVRRLRDEAEAAIGPDGRVRGEVGGSKAADEIGDLSRSFSSLLRRLGHYNSYLEGMAGKLAHELRTPVAVVRSSLENLEHAGSEAEARTYRERAREGIERLGTILQRLSEATRLEQALQTSERERFDLGGLVTACLDGYRAAYPQARFELDTAPGDLTVEAAPDLIAQLLDKLIANAVDFAEPDTAIRLAVEPDGTGLRLSVANQGPPLPESMRERLFESMVSLREKKGDGPHLGLGLHIVRLIAEFHQGGVEAENTDGGVRLVVRLPRRLST